jgi:hypothetical protein
MNNVPARQRHPAPEDKDVYFGSEALPSSRIARTFCSFYSSCGSTVSSIRRCAQVARRG